MVTLDESFATFKARPAHPRLWGAFLACAAFAGLIAVWWLLVVTATGQFLEQSALWGSRIGARFVTDHARLLLHLVSLPAAIVLVLVILLGVLWRGSRRRALHAAAVVVGVNLSTQVLKQWVLWRPDYGYSLRYDGANTLPSGHTAMAASAAVALVLVVGPQWRGVAAWVGALMTTAMGYSTLVCQWHRPADILAAIFLAVAWGGAAVAVGAWERDADDPGPSRLPAHGRRAIALLGAIGGLGGVAAVGMELWMWFGTTDDASRTDVFIAYAAGSVGTMAAACGGLAALAGLTSRTVGAAAGRRLKTAPEQGPAKTSDPEPTRAAQPGGAAVNPGLEPGKDTAQQLTTDPATTS